MDVVDPTRRRNMSQGNFAPNYRQGVMTRIQGYYTKRGTKKKVDINHDPHELMKAMSIILPDFTIAPSDDMPFYNLHRISDGSKVTSVQTLSSGESQLVSLGMDILTIVGIWQLDQTSKRILLIDEPDAHIHPDLQVKLADFLCYIEEAFDVQIFVATHSTTLLSAIGQFGGGRVSVLYLEPGAEGLRGERFNDVTRELSSILGGHLVMGPLFSAPILLVEGDDDYRIWIHAARGGKLNLCVLPCNGDEIKKYQRTLERMFGALSETVCLRGLALLDGDKGLPTPSPGNEQQFVSFARLSCRESENLYLTDEVLTELGHTWESAIAAIHESADQFGQKRSLLESVGAMDRREDDFKQIINEVANIIDPKQLLWSTRIGKVLGRGQPEGMLKDFIGEYLVKQIWPLPYEPY